MNKEIQSIIRRLENINSGEPWFGRAVYSILEEIDPKKTFTRPNNSEHSLAELLYHMITWADFTLKRIEGDKINDLAAAEELDWRMIDPKIHTWKKGLVEFKSIHKKITDLLKTKDDDFLKENVDYRKYDYRFLINGLIEHNIYHLGQVAYLKKLLD
ncbi:MAG: DinB family protein [Chitinophagaceae bacterium]